MKKMTDREKLEKVLAYVTQREDKFYKPIEDGKYEGDAVYVSGSILSGSEILY